MGYPRPIACCSDGDSVAYNMPKIIGSGMCRIPSSTNAMESPCCPMRPSPLIVNASYNTDYRSPSTLGYRESHRSAREIRNYRPITLLNADYKIMSKALVGRMLKLVEALADEEQAEGLMIAADWEKAFDRVSWDYHKAARRAR